MENRGYCKFVVDERSLWPWNKTYSSDVTQQTPLYRQPREAAKAKRGIPKMTIPDTLKRTENKRKNRGKGKTRVSFNRRHFKQSGYRSVAVELRGCEVCEALSRCAPDQTTFIHTHKVVARCCAASDEASQATDRSPFLSTQSQRGSYSWTTLTGTNIKAITTRPCNLLQKFKFYAGT
jgi:hypothetical protein